MSKGLIGQRDTQLEYGNRCLLLDKKNNNKWVVVLREDASLSTHIGEIPHKSILEAGYGGVLLTSSNKECHVRKISLEEYTKTLKRRVTPIYPKDMGRISTLMDLQPGDRVLEAGTGTGCMTLHLARCVGPSGEVWSYEKRNDFHRNAKHEISFWNSENQSIKLFQGSLEECDAQDEHFDSLFLDLSDTGHFLEKSLRFVKKGSSIVILLLHTSQVCDLNKFIKENDIKVHWESVLELSERTWVVDYPKCRPKSFEASVHTGFLVHLIKAN